MAQHNVEILIPAPFRDVVKHFEAFLKADDQRTTDDHQPGTTVSVTKLNRNTFEEGEVDSELAMVLSMMGADDAVAMATTTTRYQLSAAPGGTRVAAVMTINDEVEDLVRGMAELMGEVVPENLVPAADLEKWAQRAVAYVQVQKQASGPAKGGLE